MASKRLGRPGPWLWQGWPWGAAAAEGGRHLNPLEGTPRRQVGVQVGGAIERVEGDLVLAVGRTGDHLVRARVRVRLGLGLREPNPNPNQEITASSSSDAIAATCPVSAETKSSLASTSMPCRG